MPIQPALDAITNINRVIYLSGEQIEEGVSDEESGGATGVVRFDVQPNVSESGSANYVNIDDMRQAGTLMIYSGSPGREFSINARFVSRTREEAERNARNVQLLRSWRLPETTGELGDESIPPAPSRLRLFGLNKWFNSIHVRMTNLSIETNDDTDYIYTPHGSVPIFWNVNINLKETRSYNELKRFNIVDFRQGTLKNW